MAFTEITTETALNALFTKSEQEPVLLFKHSLTCPISHGAHEEMSLMPDEVNMIVVQDSRPLSNEIETRTGIEHESPQLIILKDGAQVWNAAHGDITKASVTRALSEIESK